MKLIIDIPEEDYIRLRDEGMFGNVTTFKQAVREGIPLAEQEPCEMTAEEYRQRMIQAFHNADCDELIALVVLPTEKEFEHLEWLLEKHYKAKPESCEDAISRQAAIDACLNGWNKDYKEIVEEIRALPPVTPAEKVGRWIKEDEDDSFWLCSECGQPQWELYGIHYCPGCGAKMQEVTNEID